MDQGEEIRFRVTDEVFVDTSPTGPAAAATDTPAQPGQSTAPPAEGSGEKKEPPYTLIVSQYSVTHTHVHQRDIHPNASHKMWKRDPGSPQAPHICLTRCWCDQALMLVFMRFVKVQSHHTENPQIENKSLTKCTVVSGDHLWAGAGAAVMVEQLALQWMKRTFGGYEQINHRDWLDRRSDWSAGDTNPCDTEVKTQSRAAFWTKRLLVQSDWRELCHMETDCVLNTARNIPALCLHGEFN